VTEALAPAVVRAAGVVLWRPTGAGLEIAVVHRPKYDDWSLPKGKVDPGEHLLACAVRETLEETGHRVVLGPPVGTLSYPVGETTKEVHYWLARADDAAPPWPGSAEIDALDFLPLAAALDRLTHPHDATLATDAAGLLGSPPLAPAPLVVLRHGKAVPRGRWTQGDDSRPLDLRGFAEAARLTLLLGCFGALRVITSPSRRCTQTVLPYATASRQVVETDERLSEEAFDLDPAGAKAAVHEILDDGRPAVICSHRPVLPTLFAAAGIPKPARQLRPGDFVVAHWRHEDLAAVERHSA
jgi:8-oxo-dGTP diphosphatase